jgi:hypothetical protein
MNIIFKEHAEEIAKKYTVLDLDTFQLPDGTVHTACCVVEQIPIMELATVSSLRELHENLITNYAKQDWNYCEQALEQLMGKWGGELDSFYIELKTRIESLKTMPLDHNWTPVIPRN